MLKGRYVRVDIAEARSDSFEQKTFASDWRSGVSHQISERNPSSAGRPNFESTTRFQERVFDRSTMSPVMAEARLATSDWRSNAKPMTSERPTPAASSDVSSKATPAKKPVLNLLPRTKPLPSGVPEPADVYVTKGKSNPFGAAKPIEKPAATNE